jgi:hypothetical protein
MGRTYAESGSVKTSAKGLQSKAVNPTLRRIVTFLCIAGSIAAAYNVLADNGDVEKMAEGIACAEPVASAKPASAAPGACKPQMTRMDRSPFAQTFEFATSKGTVGVRCARSAVLVGDYACSLR